MFIKPFQCVIQKRYPLKSSVRLRHKTNKQTVEKPAPKLAPDVVKYLQSSPEYHGLIDKLPNTLLRKYKAPESMYLINKNTAQNIAKAVEKYLVGYAPLVEVNPGVGFLTQELLKLDIKHIYLYESLNHFDAGLSTLQAQYPDRISYKIADFFGMWKLAFQDKMDQGHRLREMLGDLATEDNDRTVKIVGSMPGLSFVKHLIYNMVFFNMNDQLGRPDLFITMPAQRFEKTVHLVLTDKGRIVKPLLLTNVDFCIINTEEQFLTDSEIQLGKHKSMPALFQLLFDCKKLTTVPTVHYLPWLNLSSKNNLLTMDECRHYLVNISRKEKLPCPPEYLPLLWYFFKPHVFSKSTRIIPMLEQWIPGCGVWLITGQDPPESKKDIAPGPEDAPLPHMTIFTEFGDLSLRQKLTVFKKFVSWPEFEQCQFRITMESNLPRFVSAVDEDKDTIGTHIDDVEHSDGESDS